MDLRRQLLANSVAQMVLVVVIVVLANTWAASHFVRADLTADKVHSLSIATRRLVGKLDKPLTAKVFFTGDLEAPYNNHERVVVDTLEELRAYSKGLMDIEVIDPGASTEAAEEARGFGIEPLQLRTRFELRQVTMGVALVYGGKQQSLPAITQVQSLEYDLAGALKLLVTDEERKTVAFSTGHGEPDILGATQGPLRAIRDQLGERMNLASIPLGGPGLIPEDIDAFFVVGPVRPLSDRARFQLDQFLMRGGSLALLVSNTKPDLRAMAPQSVLHGLEPLLSSYGVAVNRDLVLDRQRNGIMRFPTRQGRAIVQVPVNYPLIPTAVDLDQNSLVVKDLDAMMFPFASSITLADPLPEGVRGDVLARSSASSSRVQGLRNLDPNVFREPLATEEPGPWPLLVALQGAWRSAFSGQSPPEPVTDAPAYDTNKPPPPDKAPIVEGVDARLVVAGSADFIANNVPLVLNLADWMVQDENLIGIRSKQVQIPELAPMTDATRQMWKLLNLLGGTAVLLVFGATRWALRRSTGGAPKRPASSAVEGAT